MSCQFGRGGGGQCHFNATQGRSGGIKSTPTGGFAFAVGREDHVVDPPTHISNELEASDLNHYLTVGFDLYSLKELTTYFYGGDISGILALEMALVSKGLNDVHRSKRHSPRPIDWHKKKSLCRYCIVLPPTTFGHTNLWPITSRHLLSKKGT